jgi:5-methylcytosine-specific restriction endonuclease McrA
MICGKEYKSLKGISTHIIVHKITAYEYYEKFLKKENEGVCLNHGKVKDCKKDTTWINMVVGYHKYCSVKCMTKSDNFRKMSSESKKGDKHWLKKEGNIHPNKNKTYEEIYGLEKAKQLKENLSWLGKQLTGLKNPFYNHNHTSKTREILRNNKLGKTNIELYGCDKAKEIKLKQSKPQKKPWLSENNQLYTSKFYNKKFRKQILIDQNMLCGYCSCKLFKNYRHLHHINFIKCDDRRENLIYLCPSCHGKTKNRVIYKETMKFLNDRNQMILESVNKKG